MIEIFDAAALLKMKLPIFRDVIDVSALLDAARAQAMHASLYCFTRAHASAHMSSVSRRLLKTC